MKHKVNNENYAARVVKIDSIVNLPNCDNVVHAIISGNRVIVSKDTKVGDIGLFFPLETQLSKEFLHNNNLYRHENLNKDITKKGYFEENGRIRCVKFRNNVSEGLFMPLSSVEFTGIDAHKLELGDCFDGLNEIPICCKYVVVQRTPGQPNNKKSKKEKSRLIENQFRFHKDTCQLYNNVHNFKTGDVVCITPKYHGTSAIFSNVLCQKKLGIVERIAKFFGMNVKTTEYSDLYSTRRVVKNDIISISEGFYKHDVWYDTWIKIKDLISKGMTLYGEIVGYVGEESGNKFIQKDYDYGCEPGTNKFLVYRITVTNEDGIVFELNPQHVTDWCKSVGLETVFEKAEYLIITDNMNILEYVKNMPYMEKDCPFCVNKVPFEGYVVRKMCLDLEAYKVKANAFYERETKLLDKGEVDMEEAN